MKKFVILTIFVFLITLIFSSCSLFNTCLGVHTSDEKYFRDDVSHWKKCAKCDSIFEKTEHVLNSDGMCDICQMVLLPTEGVMYELSEDGTYARVIGYNGTNDRVRFAEVYQNTPVKTIKEHAFEGNLIIVDVIIPNSIIKIGDRSFMGCRNMETIFIGENVLDIGEDVFLACNSLISIEVDENNTSYKSIDGNLYTYDFESLIQYSIGKIDDEFVVPEGVVYIERYSFFGADVKSVVLPDTVKVIGFGAFTTSSINSITIGCGVQIINNDAFGYCTNLSDVYYCSNEIDWSNIIIEYCNEYLLDANIHYKFPQ